MNIGESILIKTPGEAKRDFPIEEGASKQINKHRETFRDVMNGNNKQKTILILGPCSIISRDQAKVFLDWIKEMKDKYDSDSLEIWTRLNAAKPRSDSGYTGLLYVGDAKNPTDMNAGIDLYRKILLYAVEKNIPVASEILDPSMWSYFGDLISVARLGSRDSKRNDLKQMVSRLGKEDIPFLVKNPEAGEYTAWARAIKGCKSTRGSTAVLGDNGRQYQTGKTFGNKNVRPFLRGEVHGGKKIPNFYPENIQEVQSFMQDVLGKTLNFAVDLNHANNPSGDPEGQVENLRLILEKTAQYGKNMPRVFVAEVNNKPGKQPLGKDNWKEELPKLNCHISVTDACLGKGGGKELIQLLA